MQNMGPIVNTLGVGVALVRLLWDVCKSRSGGSGYEFIFGRSARGGALHYLKALEGDDGWRCQWVVAMSSLNASVGVR